jgi:hypothetical protein
MAPPQFGCIGYLHIKAGLSLPPVPLRCALKTEPCLKKPLHLVAQSPCVAAFRAAAAVRAIQAKLGHEAAQAVAKLKAAALCAYGV